MRVPLVVRGSLTLSSARRAAFVIAVLAGSSIALGAQDTAARALRLGTPMNASLTEGDPTFEERGAFHVYRLEAKAGDRFIITMRSESFDAYVWVARSVGVLTASVASDDDSGGDTDARLRWRAQAAGTYYVVAQSLSSDGQGAYTLTVEQAPPPAPVVATELSLGKSVEGSINESSPMLEDETPPIPFALYTFRGSGERVRITMRSGAFDAFLRVTRVTPDGEVELGTDDDSGGGTDASLAVEAPGLINIYARPLDANATGSFTISLAAAPMARVISRTITVGQTIAGSLTTDDPEMENGKFFHQYALTGTAGARVRVVFRSEAFDAFITASQPGETFTPGETDDDSAGGTDAQLDLTLPSSGVLLIRVHGLGSGQTGNYTLEVDKR